MKHIKQGRARRIQRQQEAAVRQFASTQAALAGAEQSLKAWHGNRLYLEQAPDVLPRLQRVVEALRSRLVDDEARAKALEHAAY